MDPNDPEAGVFVGDGGTFYVWYPASVSLVTPAEPDAPQPLSAEDRLFRLEVTVSQLVEKIERLNERVEDIATNDATYT